MINVVAVKFKQYGSMSYTSSDYHYLTDLELKVGDEVVVDSPQQGRVVVSVTKIMPTQGEGSKVASKWIVQKVDLEEYKRREELARRKKVIETKLNMIEQKVASEMKFQYLAQISPEAAELLRELKEIR